MTGADRRERITLRFAGLDGGYAELTWGQRFVWDILRALAPDNHYISIRLRVHLPTDATRESVLAALHTVVSEYEVLRTRFRAGPDGEPRQQCDRDGELAVSVCDTAPGRVRALADEEEERLWHEPFRGEHEWPLRVSVVGAGGRPRQAVFVFSHLAVDAWGCGVLRARFLDLLRTGATGGTSGTEPAPAGWQPRARAEFERSEPARAANDVAVGYWRRILDTAPQTAFPVLPEAGQSPLFPGVSLHSVALAAAVRAVATRLRVGPAAVLLGAVASVIGLRTGTDTVPLLLAAGNRATAPDAASVSTSYQVAPALFQLDAGSLVGTIRAAHRASTSAYLRGDSDPRDIAQLVDAVNARRGIHLDLGSTVNVVPEPGFGAPSTPPDTAELRRLTASTRVSDLEGREREQLKIYVHAKSLRSRAIIEMFCDSRYLDQAAARRILTGLELVLIEVLEAGDVDGGRVAELIGIEPMAAPKDSVLIDHCRIDPAAVRALLAGLPGTAAAGVFTSDPADGPVRMVAYVAADRPTTPEAVHDALVRALDGALTMAPHHYVVCQDAPDRPESRGEWERRPVLAQGGGRAGGPPADPRPTPPIHANRGA